MAEVLEDVKAIQTAAGWIEIRPGTLRATVTEVLGERLPALVFTDAKGREQVVPRSAVCGFEGELVTPPDRSADDARARAASMKAAVSVLNVRGGQLALGVPTWATPQRWAEMERQLVAALDDRMSLGVGLDVASDIVVGSDVGWLVPMKVGERLGEWLACNREMFREPGEPKACVDTIPVQLTTKINLNNMLVHVRATAGEVSARVASKAS